jgi:hypothetical protein
MSPPPQAHFQLNGKWVVTLLSAAAAMMETVMVVEAGEVSRWGGGRDRCIMITPPMIGIVQKVLSTTSQTILHHHHHGGGLRLSCGVGSMDPPNPTKVSSSEGVGWGRVGWVSLYC